MKIAVLGWGSLIWEPKELEANKEWNSDGPFLPVEFARISNNGRLTLVIKENMKPVQVLWTLMKSNKLSIARKSLMEREGTSEKRIGFVNLTKNTECSKYNNISEVIKQWAKEKEVDAVIWTDLGVKFNDAIDKELNIENVVNYLSNLSGEKKVLAKEYIIRAPKQIKTEFRKAIENKLNLT